MLDETRLRLIELLTEHQGCLDDQASAHERLLGDTTGAGDRRKDSILNLNQRCREIDGIITTLTS